MQPLHRLERRSAVFRLANYFESVRLENRTGSRAKARVVVDDQDGGH